MFTECFTQILDGLYRIFTIPRKFRFGFAGQSAKVPFSEAVTKSLRSAAQGLGFELLVLDNRYNARRRSSARSVR
jgi:ribose transport system substrate-binding protein